MKFLLVLLVLAAPVEGRGDLLSLVPDDPNPAPGTTISVSVEIAAVEVGCFSFSVEYDESVLTYLGASEGPLFANSPELTYFSDDVDPLGRPQPNDCLLGFGTAVAGPGTIAVITFAVISDEPTRITLMDPVLRDIDRVEIDGLTEVATWLNASATSTPASLGQNELLAWPNPFSSHLSLVLSGDSPITTGRLQIYDLSGRRVRELLWPAGVSSQSWDGRDDNGRMVSNGVYHARLESSSRRAGIRIVRMR